MATTRETKAINRLRQAQQQYDATRAQYKHHTKAQGTPADIAINAAYNELQNADFPFATGKYAYPDDMRSGITNPPSSANA